MILKKLSTFFLVFVFMLALPISSTFAHHSDPAGWQNIGKRTSYWSDYWHNNSLTSYSTGKDAMVYAAGGNAKVCGLKSGYYYTLMEYDPGSNKDETIGNLYRGSDGCATKNISAFDDGTNGDAELYVRTSAPYHVLTFYD